MAKQTLTCTDVLENSHLLELVWLSIAMRANYIETGDVAVSAKDARNMGKPQMIRPLTEDQDQTVYELRQLVNCFMEQRFNQL